MKKHDFKVREEANQNLGHYLPRLESELSKGAFFARLCQDSDLDPNNFVVGNVEIELKDGPRMFPVIVGEHVRKRMDQRTMESLDNILAKAIYWLRSPLIGQRVAGHPVVWDDEALKAVSYEEDGITSTALLLEAEDLVLCFEAGFNYIRVKTVFKGVCQFNPNATTCTIQVCESGAVRAIPYDPLRLPSDVLR